MNTSFSRLAAALSLLVATAVATTTFADPLPGRDRLKFSQQPVRLLIENAATNGVRPLSYTFELASDSAFQTKVFARSGVTPGADGKTSVTIEKLDIGRGYYWRARAEDGANTGPYVTVAFEILPQPALGVPTLVSPINNERVGSARPTFTFGGSSKNAAVGTVTYELQVAVDAAFAQVVASGLLTDPSAQVTFVPPNDLPGNRQHYWRVRASDGETTSAWAGTQTFLTPAAAPTPTPTPNPGGGPCNSSNPEAIVACERAKFGHMSHGQMFSFVQAVTKSLNRNGIGGGPFGILRKQSGTNCNGYSCDVVCAGQGGGQRQYDVLGDIDGAQTPGWGLIQGSIRVDVCEIQ